MAAAAGSPAHCRHTYLSRPGAGQTEHQGPEAKGGRGEQEEEGGATQKESAAAAEESAAHADSQRIR